MTLILHMSIVQFMTACFVLLAIMLVTWRFLRLPGIINRLVALDTLNVITVGVFVLGAGIMKNVIYLEIALVYAAFSFIGMIAITQLLGRR